MTNLKWQIGEFEIFQIVEIEAGEVIQNIIPNAIPSTIRKMPELTPDFANENGKLNAVVQCFLVKSRGKNILIDTCNGNFKRRPDLPEWGSVRTGFLERFRETGIEVNQVDIVICTHLHFDHVGWNTFLQNGKWVPTFPRAKYLFIQKEFDFWSQEPRDQIASDLEAFQDSVMPIVDAGMATFVDPDYILNENIHFIPTHGHTPGHICVNIESQGKRAIVIGDLIFHPCQIINPSWVTHSDQDPAKSVEVRNRILNEVADTNTILLGAHFPKPVAISVIRSQNGFNFRREQVMPRAVVHQCECPHCQQETPHPDQELHRQMNLLLSQLDEQQRRWYVAVESKRVGVGGDRLLAQITGLDEKTIQRGRQELAGELSGRSEQRVRLPGGGRPSVEKKTPHSR